MLREIEEEARDIRDIPSALHFLVLAKAVKTIEAMGGEADTEHVTRRLAEELDESTARAWAIVLTRRRVAEIRGGRVRLLDAGFAMVRRGVADRAEQSALAYLSLVGWRLKE